MRYVLSPCAHDVFTNILPYSIDMAHGPEDDGGDAWGFKGSSMKFLPPLLISLLTSLPLNRHGHGKYRHPKKQSQLNTAC
jgi:hypothetical protein